MKKKINIIIMIAFLLGIIGGIFLPNLMSNLSFIGTMYINILKFMIIPILFTSVSLSIYKNLTKKNNKIIKTILLFISMFIITFIITSIFVLIIKPGLNYKLDGIVYGGEVAKFTMMSFMENIFPANPIDIITKTNILAIIIISSLFGYAAAKINNSDKTMDLIESINKVLYKMLEYIMYLTPFAVFSLIGTSISTYGINILKNTFVYIILVYLISIFIMFLMMIMVSKKIKPLNYLKKISKIWVITASTCSSVATLPYTLKLCREELDLNNDTTDLVIPLGTTINKVGGAVSFAILSIFTAQLFGIEITFSLYLSMIIVSLLLNMAAVGIPSGGIVLGATYLSMLGIPLTFMGIYSGIYRLLDMAYTTLNVTGNITAGIILNKNKWYDYIFIFKNKIFKNKKDS